MARGLPVSRRDVFVRTLEAGPDSGEPKALHNQPGQGPMANPFEFIQQVRSEASKVTWPTRRETLITTGLVIAMVIVASLFFIAVDQSIRIGLSFIMSIGR